jgi:CBS-domain-containing membrane protein
VCAALAPSSAGRQVRRLPVVDRGKAAVGIVALGEFAVDIPETFGRMKQRRL